MAWDIDRSARRLLAPSSWRVRTRRVFVLTFPLSVPLWLGAIVGVGVLRVARFAGGPVTAFWNDPPKRLSSGSYGYSPRQESSAKVTKLDSRRRRKAA